MAVDSGQLAIYTLEFLYLLVNVTVVAKIPLPFLYKNLSG